jgi:hypothetical protein
MSEPGVEDGVAEVAEAGAGPGGGAAVRAAGERSAGGHGASVRFARTAQAVGDVARAEGWTVPGFRSPPRLSGVERTVRRRADGGAVVAVRVRGRPWAAMAADLIEGVVVTNCLQGAEAQRCRNRLWESLVPPEEPAERAA